uniref:aralkylamine N-acetyltransferase n=1 Tax=Ascaris lumbricoides TaxID=6252 RepID=A0A0M3HY75_ASCLU
MAHLFDLYVYSAQILAATWSPESNSNNWAMKLNDLSLLTSEGPGRHTDMRRSASSVTSRPTPEPDVSEHFRRSLSGKWPRRQVNHAAHYTPLQTDKDKFLNSLTNNRKGLQCLPLNARRSPPSGASPPQHIVVNNSGIERININNRSVIYIAKNERFCVRTATLSHLDRMVDFLANVFIEKEPLARAMRLRRDEAIDMLLYIARRCIPMGLSCIVNEEHSDEIVAVRLFGVAQRDDLPEQLPIRLSKNAQRIADFLNETKRDFWNQVEPDVNRVITREITSVSDKYMRKGIATFLVSHLLDSDTVKRLDAQGIKSEATSLANQKLLYKNGYRMLKEIKHSEYLDEYGRQIFNCDDGTDRIMLFYKRLVHK